MPIPRFRCSYFMFRRRKLVIIFMITVFVMRSVILKMFSFQESDDADTNPHDQSEIEPLPYDATYKRKMKEFIHKNTECGAVGSQKEELEREAYRYYGFNQHASDCISMERELGPTHQSRSCPNIDSSEWNVKTSVIIIFFQEGWSTLGRTVLSVINNSPRNLLHEIILVDDHSTFGKVEELYNILRIKYGELIKLHKRPIRDGLISARIDGSQIATGDILVFLDSHCEARENWLVHLVEPILKNYRTITCPIIDVIQHQNFDYTELKKPGKGTFNWMFLYKEREHHFKQSTAELIPSPVMAGGLFAISKKWWDELGQYDPELYIWGGEQYELSFKTWMCHGEMYNVPCSRVGHVYRGPGRSLPDHDKVNSRHPNAVSRNFRRVAEVWLDDYKYFLFKDNPSVALVENYDKDLESRRQIREKLKCHSFQWYLKNVINETLVTAYEPNRAKSDIRNNATNLCISSGGQKNKITLNECHNYQDFAYTWIYEFKNGEHCWDSRNSHDIFLDWCHENGGNQEFRYDPVKKIIQSAGKCVTAVPGTRKVILKRCQLGDSDTVTDVNQLWNMQMSDVDTIPSWAALALHPARNR